MRYSCAQNESTIMLSQAYERS